MLKNTFTILSILFCLKSFAAIPVTANAGNDTTIYLTQSSSAILNGSGTGSSTPTYQWTKITDIVPYWLTAQTNNSVITSSASAVSTVTGLEQGTWYYELSVTVGIETAKDTVVIRVDYDVPPAGGTLLRALPLSTIASVANDRHDTTGYLGYSVGNYDNGNPNPALRVKIWFERSRLNGAMIDSARGKLYTTLEDGYPWNGGGYGRSELTYGNNLYLDTNKTYVMEWKGYFPQSITSNIPLKRPRATNTTAKIIGIMQIHGAVGSPPYSVNVYRDSIQLEEYGGEGNGSNAYAVIMPTNDSYVMKTHTVRLTLREGKGYPGQPAFIKLEVDGVQKYLRNTGTVGQSFGQDYIKFGSLYDWSQSVVDMDSLARKKKFSLVTEAFNVYTLSNAQVPAITWNNPTAITYGTALSSAQINATASVLGTFTYNYAIGNILNAGTYTLTTTFQPNDNVNYTSATKSVTLVVNKALATLTASGMTVTYTGLPQQPTVTTSPAGLVTVDKTYNNSASTPTNAGSYTFAAGLTNQNYYATPISGTFVINKATTTITVSNLNQTYTGSPLAVTATTTPNVSGLTVTYNGSATVPTTAGSYTVVASLSNANYQATTVTTTLVINKATPTVTWSNPSAITYGTALSSTQLNATASVAGTFVYSPASGVFLNAGVNNLSVNFTPTDATNYNSVNNTTASLTVNKATAIISLSNLTQTSDGNPKPVTVTTSPVGLTIITTTYNGSATVPSAPGSYSVSTSLSNSNYAATPATGTLVISSSVANIYITNFNKVYNGAAQTPTVTSSYSYSITYNGSPTPPTNTGNYTTIATINDGVHTGADTVTMTIIKATPVIVWANPSAITFGTALSGTQLNATTSVSGSFTYLPASGTILNAGTYVLSTSFTPTDASNYNTATAEVTITVNKASATLTLSNLNQAYDGTPKPVTITSSPSGLDGITLTYNGSVTVPTSAGSYAVIGSLINSNYTASDVSGTLVISNASYILSWSTPTPMQQGTSLSAIQLNATSNIAGTFTYNYPLGYVVQNDIVLTATFHPTNTNYNTQTISVLLSVYGNPFVNFLIGTYFKNELP
jgi:hypothetical protein